MNVSDLIKEDSFQEEGNYRLIREQLERQFLWILSAQAEQVTKSEVFKAFKVRSKSLK